MRYGRRPINLKAVRSLAGNPAPLLKRGEVKRESPRKASRRGGLFVSWDMVVVEEHRRLQWVEISYFGVIRRHPALIGDSARYRVESTVITNVCEFSA